MLRAIEVDDAVIQLPFEGHGYVRRSLENLEWVIQCHDARDARDVALVERIEFRPIPEVFFPLSGGRGLIWDGAAVSEN
jgi:hypothetical protein